MNNLEQKVWETIALTTHNSSGVSLQRVLDLHKGMPIVGILAHTRPDDPRCVKKERRVFYAKPISPEQCSGCIFLLLGTTTCSLGIDPTKYR